MSGLRVSARVGMERVVLASFLALCATLLINHGGARTVTDPPMPPMVDTSSGRVSTVFSLPSCKLFVGNWFARKLCNIQYLEYYVYSYLICTGCGKVHRKSTGLHFFKLSLLTKFSSSPSCFASSPGVHFCSIR